MSDNERKELIIRMLEVINDSEQLKRIFNYVHNIFIRRTGE